MNGMTNYMLNILTEGFFVVSLSHESEYWDVNQATTVKYYFKKIEVVFLEIKIALFVDPLMCISF
jgi:hypothetical protein